MKKLNFIIPLFVLISLLTSCHLLKQHESMESIDFGGQGGFIAQTTKFTLNKDGKIYKNDTLITQIDSKQVDLFFSQASELKSPISHPGSYSFFLIVHTNLQEKIWVWTPEDKENSEFTSLNRLYKELTEIVKY